MRQARFASIFLLSLTFCAAAPYQAAKAPASTAAKASSATKAPPPNVGNAKFVRSKELTRDQMEQFLLTARIVGQRPIEKGITHTFRITLTDGKIYHDAHVQQIDEYKAEYRSKDGIEKNFSDSYKYNIAAYRLDKMMDMNDIPPCVLREVNGKPSAVDWWVDDVQFDEEERRDKNAEPPDLNSWGRQLNDIRDFDTLIYNVDRNQGNVLIDKDWKVWAIDHSRSFRTLTTLRDTSILRRISTKLLNAFKALKQDEVHAALTPLISDEAISAMMARRDLLVHFFETQISEKGQDVVLTDLPRHTEHVTIP